MHGEEVDNIPMKEFRFLIAIDDSSCYRQKTGFSERENKEAKRGGLSLHYLDGRRVNPISAIAKMRRGNIGNLCKKFDVVECSL